MYREPNLGQNFKRRGDLHHQYPGDKIGRIKFGWHTYVDCRSTDYHFFAHEVTFVKI